MSDDIKDDQNRENSNIPEMKKEKTSHDIKEEKRKEKEHQREKESKAARQAKMKKTIGILAAVGVFVAIFGGLIYLVIAQPAKPVATLDLAGIPSGFIHWHADIDIILCGQDTSLPEPPLGGELGTSTLHLHDKSTNLNSMPESDGNGVIHIEGDVSKAPQQYTLGKIMEVIGVPFSNTSIMNYKNGDTCPNATTAGTVKVFRNNRTLENALYFIPRDHDFIRIEFG